MLQSNVLLKVAEKMEVANSSNMLASTKLQDVTYHKNMILTFK